MSILYHASPIAGISVLEPRISNHGEARIYFSSKRENVLVYLSNAVEKYCNESGFKHDGTWYKWAAYGFTKQCIIRLEEYYPNATEETYSGVSGYIYTATHTDAVKPLDAIRDAYYSETPIDVIRCEYIPDAYQAILQAEKEGRAVIKRYEELNKAQHKWIHDTIAKEYAEVENRPEYRHFLKAKFPFIK